MVRFPEIVYQFGDFHKLHEWPGLNHVHQTGVKEIQTLVLKNCSSQLILIYSVKDFQIGLKHSLNITEKHIEREKVLFCPKQPLNNSILQDSFKLYIKYLVSVSDYIFVIWTSIWAENIICKYMSLLFKYNIFKSSWKSPCCCQITKDIKDGKWSALRLICFSYL